MGGNLDRFVKATSTFAALIDKAFHWGTQEKRSKQQKKDYDDCATTCSRCQG